MECTIYFINKKVETIAEAEELLMEQVTKIDDHFISATLRDEIAQEFYNSKLDFHLEKKDKSLTIDFDAYDYGVYFTEEYGEITFYYDTDNHEKIFIDHLETVLAIIDSFQFTTYCPMIDQEFDPYLGEMEIIDLMRSELTISKEIPEHYNVENTYTAKGKKEGFLKNTHDSEVTVKLLFTVVIITIVCLLVVFLGLDTSILKLLKNLL